MISVQNNFFKKLIFMITLLLAPIVAKADEVLVTSINFIAVGSDAGTINWLQFAEGSKRKAREDHIWKNLCQLTGEARDNAQESSAVLELAIGKVVGFFADKLSARANKKLSEYVSSSKARADFEARDMSVSRCFQISTMKIETDENGEQVLQATSHDFVGRIELIEGIAIKITPLRIYYNSTNIKSKNDRIGLSVALNGDVYVKSADGNGGKKIEGALGKGVIYSDHFSMSKVNSENGVYRPLYEDTNLVSMQPIDGWGNNDIAIVEVNSLTTEVGTPSFVLTTLAKAYEDNKEKIVKAIEAAALAALD